MDSVNEKWYKKMMVMVRKETEMIRYTEVCIQKIFSSTFRGLCDTSLIVFFEGVKTPES